MYLRIDEELDTNQAVREALTYNLLPVLDYFGFEDVVVRVVDRLSGLIEEGLRRLADDTGDTGIRIYVTPLLPVPEVVPLEHFEVVTAFNSDTICYRHRNVVIVHAAMLPRLWELFAYGTEQYWDRNNFVTDKEYGEEPYTLEKMVEELVEGYSKRLADEAGRLTSRLEDARMRYREAAETIVDTSTQIETLTKFQIASEAAMANIDLDAQRAKYMKDIEELRASPLLKDVKVERDQLVFYTELITVYEEDGVTRPFGSYKVSISLKNASMIIENLDNKQARGDYIIPHPHCSESGEPCMGNLASVLPELVTARDLLGIWQVTLSFLSSYNEDDSWGERYRYWPAYDARGNKIDDDVTCYACECVLECEEEEYECCECGEIFCYDCVSKTDDEDYVCNRCSEGKYCYNCEVVHFREELHCCEQCGEWSCDRQGNYITDCDGNNEVFVCCDDCEGHFIVDNPEYDPDYYNDEEDEEDEDWDAEYEAPNVQTNLDREIEQAITGGV